MDRELKDATPPVASRVSSPAGYDLVPGLGLRVQGAGCKVQGAGCRVQGAGCRVQGAGCRV